jgi:tRNA(fMet)-specific endonuclease VapC
MAFLLDTSALSEPLRRLPREQFLRQLRRVAPQDLYTSTVCLMELRYGCALRKDSGLWSRIEKNVLNLVTPLPFGPDEAIRCGELLAELAKKGRPIGIEDTQIGATALVHNLTVVTFNVKHFQTIDDLRVETWLD